MADHPRILTKRQFSDGYAIDAMDLDAATEEAVERANNVPGGDRARRFVPVITSFGWTPNAWSRRPWLSLRNKGTADDVVGPLPDAAQNAYRLKGSLTPGIDLTDGPASQGETLVLMHSLASTRPYMLDAVSLMLVSDTGPLGNTFQWDAANPPEGENASDPSRDIVLSVTVDNPFRPESQRQASPIFHQHDFLVIYKNITALTLAGLPTNDMTPTPLPNWPHKTAALSWRDLNIPVPRDARVRLWVTIPLYDGATVGQSTWGAEPWDKQSYSGSLVMLEEVS